MPYDDEETYRFSVPDLERAGPHGKGPFAPLGTVRVCVPLFARCRVGSYRKKAASEAHNTSRGDVFADPHAYYNADSHPDTANSHADGHALHHCQRDQRKQT